eukprot:jgi/Psemu1/57314/gm1.57314_g
MFCGSRRHCRGCWETGPRHGTLVIKTPAPQVLLLEHHIATLAANAHQELIPALPEGVAHSEMLQAHKVFFFIPFEFVSLVLGKGLTPHQTFQVFTLILSIMGFSISVNQYF